MSPEPVTGPIIAQLMLLILSYFCTLSESAVSGLDELKIRADSQDEEKYTPLIPWCQDSYPTLRALRMMNTIVLVFSGALSAIYLTRFPLSKLTAWFPSASPQLLSQLTLLLVLLLTAVLNQWIAGYIPRRIALQHPEETAMRMLPIIHVISAIMLPFCKIAQWLGVVVLRICGVKNTIREDEVTEEDILQLVDMGGETGSIEENEKEMIENIFAFNNRSAEDVMTHRTAVTSIWIEDDDDTIFKTIRETGLSRFPVYDEDIDDIIGIMNTRDYLLEKRREKPRKLRDILRSAYFVPETVQADELFRDMQKRKVHMAIVVDEYGGMSGIVTMEDLLEEIVGNIYDEFDPLDEAEIVKLEDNLWRVSGAASLQELGEVLDIELPLDKDYDTLGGLVFDQLTTIPNDGSHPEVEAEGLHIRVEKLSEHRVELALVSKLLPTDHDPESDNEKN